ncbi:acyl carrier protein [Streptomyces sp. NPDC004787]|uniref:acyl carrier protein n=1 Tax=Streptomyces sp. NPDC004787 TaxID=3154291 RepID=UPI0033BAA3CB
MSSKTTGTTGQFLLSTLRDLNYEVDDVTDTTPLGDGGLELESLTLAEIAMQVEQEYGVQIDDEELEALAGLDFGRLVALIDERAADPALTGRAR